MSITYMEKERIFRLDTQESTYLLGIVGSEGFVGHLYYGKRIKNVTGVQELYRVHENPYTPDENNRDRLSFYDCFPFEYSGHGIGDFRESSIRAELSDGSRAGKFTYVSHEIIGGKEKLVGLPATFGTTENAESLHIRCKDSVSGLTVVLKYSVFADVDAVIRSVQVINEGKEEIKLTKVMSASLDMEAGSYDALTLHGSWARERHMERKPIGHGWFGVSSNRGESSHQEHPFLGVLAQDAGQETGEVFGFQLVYSGNFIAKAQMSQFGGVRVVIGIEPEDFCWKLAPGESFQTPEAVLVYSHEGLGGMTRSFHDLYRNHLIRSPYLHKKRPILINNWEATYFDFNTEKIIDIARESARLGIELMVLDDGWFGNRFDDNRSLGDWKVNEEKLPGGLAYLAEQINALGMKFGLWFEPEMISPDSDLYRAHPDWAIAVPGRTAGLARNQYVLDISRKEVRDAVLEQVFAVLHSANIEYVKWDMNRPLADLYSAGLPADRQGELYHRYVLGMYEMQERLLEEFPNLLLENCSGGGARFDPGMLYYSPQIWCSDDTDAVERLMIQEGTALLYPLSAIGAHVSVCPNHTVGRTTPFVTRGNVALTGTFGYELDITKLSEEEKTMVSRQVKMYHTLNDLVREGDYYRIASYGENHLYDCYQVNSKQKDEALLFYTQVLNEPNMHGRRIRLSGMNPDACYRVYLVDCEKDPFLQETDRAFSGEVLMNAGFIMERLWGDFRSKLLYFKQIS